MNIALVIFITIYLLYGVIVAMTDLYSMSFHSHCWQYKTKRFICFLFFAPIIDGWEWIKAITK